MFQLQGLLSTKAKLKSFGQGWIILEVRDEIIRQGGDKLSCWPAMIHRLVRFVVGKCFLYRYQEQKILAIDQMSLGFVLYLIHNVDL